MFWIVFVEFRMDENMHGVVTRENYPEGLMRLCESSRQVLMILFRSKVVFRVTYGFDDSRI